MSISELVFDLWLLSVIVVFVDDFSGVVEEVEKMAQKWLKSPIPLRLPKPFSCSLCMTWWLGIIFAICVKAFSLKALAFIVLFSALTPVTLRAMQLVVGVLGKLCEVVERILKL